METAQVYERQLVQGKQLIFYAHFFAKSVFPLTSLSPVYGGPCAERYGAGAGAVQDDGERVGK